MLNNLSLLWLNRCKCVIYANKKAYFYISQRESLFTEIITNHKHNFLLVFMNKNLILALAVAGVSQVLPSAAKAESVYGNKDSSIFYLNQGRNEQAARKYSVAWKYFEKAAQYDSRNAEAQLAIAEVCLKMNRMAPALKALEAASALRPADNETKWKLVQMYYNFGQFNKVIEIMPGLHSKVADPKGWAYMLGKSYHSIQNYGKAIEFLQIAAKDEPTNPEPSYLIGRMYVQMANYKAALPYYERTLSLDSTTQPGRTYEYALVLATAGKFDASVACFQKAISRGYKPRDDFYMNMAYTMADAHKTDEALKMMKEMLSRRPQDLGLISGLADVCYHSGRYKEAIGYWDRLLAADDHNARALYQIGLAYIKMGKESDGQQLCDKAISMDPALAVLKHAKQMSF
jgi:tetratricopeptide (TPR) repeat protein